MNATLEGMAQALFKSWFVDFDPVIDNALAAGNPIPPALQARAELRRLNAEKLKSSTHHSSLTTHNLRSAHLFPAAFQETEAIGWIPVGWEAKSLGDLIDIKGGTQPPSSEFKDTQLDGYIQLVQIRDYDTTNHLTYIPDSKNLRKTTPMEIMIGRYGAAVGRILWGLEGAYNVALVRVELIDPIFRELIRTYLLAERFQNQMQAISVRSAQSGFNKGDIRSFSICVPKPS
jgi:type I restriction enzyme S subunit